MTEPMITCPKCQTEIKLTESLAAPMKKHDKIIIWQIGFSREWGDYDLGVGYSRRLFF